MDLIDRDVACQKMTALYEADCKTYGVPIPECFDSDRAIKALKELPSAQPEIIRCKDCVKCGFCGDETNLEIMGFYGFCSRAERRTDE